MKIHFAIPELQNLYYDPFCKTDVPQSVVKIFRRRVAQIDAALNEVDIAALFGPDGTGPCCYSVRLSEPYRLHLRISRRGNETFAVIDSVKVPQSRARRDHDTESAC